MAAKKKKPVRVLEELCEKSECPSINTTHWHKFDVDDFLTEKPGEYSITLRVREVK